MSPIWVCAKRGEALVQGDNQMYNFMGIGTHVPAFTTNKHMKIQQSQQFLIKGVFPSIQTDAWRFQGNFCSWVFITPVSSRHIGKQIV